MVQYVSTRGPGPTHNFLDVMMAGMAPDKIKATDSYKELIQLQPDFTL